MAYTIKRTTAEIDDTLNRAMEAEDDGRSNRPGMTFEQGVSAAIQWITGQHNENPMDD